MCQDEICKWIGTKDKILKNETSLWLSFSSVEESLEVIWRSTDPDFLEYSWMYCKKNDLWILRLLIILMMLNFLEMVCIPQQLFKKKLRNIKDHVWDRTLLLFYSVVIAGGFSIDTIRMLKRYLLQQWSLFTWCFNISSILLIQEN